MHVPTKTVSPRAATSGRLETHLNDHLAASVTAIKLMSRFQQDQGNSDLGGFAARIENDIRSDQQDLRALMDALGVKQSSIRKLTGWLAEKFTNLKLTLEDPQRRGLRALETLELVELGIDGKRLMAGLGCCFRAGSCAPLFGLPPPHR
jgi:hypothetical protein